MPTNTTVPCAKGQPTRLTDVPVTAARVVAPQGFNLLATLDTTAPTDLAGAVPMLPSAILAADLALVDLFPGVGATVHLWAWPTAGAVDVSISYA